MELRLYDTWERAERAFEPLRADGTVGLYTCGPTVYDYAHIGNLRTYLFEDALRRVLEWNGYAVRHVMNITDVGHLVSDADEGEDKMDRGARREGASAWELAARYTAAFQSDLAALGAREPTVWCRATEHIAEQIAFVEDLERGGFTYRTADGVYFDTSRQPGYGHLARLDRAGLDAGRRVALGDKRHPTDFALWKLSLEGSRRQMEWDSPWGRGFPGWHIECSAMAQKYLGALFDIHCGGEDHVPVHHTNEVAQTEARSGTRLANYWMHAAFLQLDRGKMSKSEGDFLRLATVRERGYDPRAYRYLCQTAHYRSRLEFGWESLDGAARALDRLRAGVRALADAPDAAPDPDAIARFTAAVNRDLDLPGATAVAWGVLRGALPPGARRATLLAFDRVLALGLAESADSGAAREGEEVPASVAALLTAREAARAARDWPAADRLRREIAAAGYAVEDAPGGARVRRAR